MTIPIRRAIAAMAGYTPGLQPTGKIVKLNTNENPYHPSKRVIEAVHAALASDGECARRYPDSLAVKLREALAEFDGVTPEQIVPGNGSDEILRMLITATVDPGTKIGMLWPTYSYYDFLAAQFDGEVVRHTLPPTWEWPQSVWDGDEPLLFITNPNPPVGTLYPLDQIARLCKARPNTLVVVDEAYIAFAPEGSTAVSLLGEHENLVVVRTLSKSHQLAGLRVGYAIGTGTVIETLRLIKDSYNVNALSQAAATAAIRDVDHFRETREKIIAERERLVAEIEKRGFTVPESHGNFIFALRDNAPELYRGLVDRGIYVRWFDKPNMRDGLRITVGLPQQTDALLAGLDELL